MLLLYFLLTETLYLANQIKPFQSSLWKGFIVGPPLNHPGMKKDHLRSQDWDPEVRPVALRQMESHVRVEKMRLDPDYLNTIFTPLSFRERIHLLYAYFAPREVLVTSSFGVNSAFLLHLLHQLCPQQRVHFIDTSYHFEETHAYKKTLSKRFDLTILEVHPEKIANEKIASRQLWNTDPEACCQVNKVNPLEPLKEKHAVWMSGVLGFQTSFRAGLKVFEQQEGILKFHPLIDVDAETFASEFRRYQLPPHPLAALGYGSIGCTHCTEKGAGRTGRWADQDKTECGLHPGFFQQKKEESK
jgi:phosphoadenosine phosphosulfate reductase